MATTQTTRPMTKSALALARRALGVARATLPAYPSQFSRPDYTRHQLFARLAVRQFLKLDYRGTERLVRDWPDLGRTRVPDHATLQRAGERVLKKTPPPPC